MSRTIPLFVLLIVGVALSAPGASAQTNLSAFFGLGSAWDSAAPGCVAPAFSGDVGTCDVNGNFSTPSMGSVFGVFGADFMLSHYLGVGGEYAFRFAQAPYADVNYRPNFYDFNLVYHPVTTRWVVPEIQGGLGGVDIKFYLPNSCGTFGCSGSQFLNSANHFQIHAGIGVKIYVKGGLFIKPQFDIHYAPNLVQQFGSDWVPEVTGSIGYTFGER